MTQHDAPRSGVQRLAEMAMALALAVMALAVFINVVLRYGFGLLFVWMVFIGATAAYPLGEHMAFTSLLRPLQDKPMAMKVMAIVIHAFVVLACVLVGWGAWQQVVVGLDSKSVVMGYSSALLPLPAFLSSVAIGVMALVNLLRGKAIELGHEVDVE